MKKITLLLLVTMALVAALPVLADDVVIDETVYVDPATLHIGNPPAGGDPNLVGNTFGVLQNSGGAGILNNPWLLILGVPNTTANNVFSNASITSIVSSAGGSTSWNYLGFQTTMTSGQEAYTRLGLSHDGCCDNSNNFGNWSGTELSEAGIVATSFGLYEFSINATLGGKDTVMFDFAGLPTGVIAIAYGETSSTTSSQVCTKGKNKVCTTTNTTTITKYDTPYTEAGFTKTRQTPEPASIMLLGAGILGLAGMIRRRKN